MILKRLLILVCYLLTFGFAPLLKGQEADLSATADTLSYEGTIKIRNTPKTILYARALNWMKTVYKNADSVIIAKDRFKGYIIGQAIITYTPTDFSGCEKVQGVINYNVKIELEDDLVHYKFTNFQHQANGGKYVAIPFGLITTDNYYSKEVKGASVKWKNSAYNHIKGHIKERVKLIMDNFEENMKKSITKE